jgi:AraC-like DNA-binding protein
MDIQNLTNMSLQAFKNTKENQLFLHQDSGFFLIKTSEPSELNATFYEPVLCLNLQGEKEVITGESKIIFAQGESLIVSHALPVVSRITQASIQEPYIALVLSLDISIIRSLYADFGESALSMQGANAVETVKANGQLLDSLFRLMQSSQNKIDSLVLFSQIYREVHFRLLQASYAGMLRDLLRVDSHASNISKAISIIRSQFNKPLFVTDIAKSVGMSVSSFHQHFKTITQSTPLLYQKELRLLEARRLIKAEGDSVTAAAFKVGYKSPNQFSREYTRKFAVNPSTDAKYV